MNIMKFALSVILATGVMACSQIDVAPPNQLIANIAPILNVEKRADLIMYYVKVLDSMGGMSKERSEELKAHYDVYYVYYLASNVHLAGGKTESYLAHLKLAEGELDAIETILNAGFAEGWELNSGHKEKLSQFNL